MGFLCWKSPSTVHYQKTAIENFLKGDDAQPSIFRNLGSNLSEEAKVRALAIEKSQRVTGGWGTQQGRIRESTLESAMKSLYEMISEPGHLDGYVVLAAISIFVHVMLLASWVLVDYDGVDQLVARSVGALTATDTAARLATMFTCGHVLWLVVVFHTCIGSEVAQYTPLYGPLMLVCLVIGGPACALAVNAHCEEQARLKVQKRINVGDYVPNSEVEERRGAIADCMQWLYLMVVALMAFGTLTAFGSPSLDPRHAHEPDSSALLEYYAWPYDLARASTLVWLTPLTAALAADWVGILLFGMLIAIADARKGGPPFWGISERFDGLVRVLFLVLFACPTPYLGLSLYFLLESRAHAFNPLLPDCAGGIKGISKPRAMATWEARVQFEQNRSLV